jgi:uncharacterized membrane protein
MLIASVGLLFGAFLFYLPFFTSYVNVGASGIGLVQAGDDLGLWLLLWGGLGFLILSWLLWRVRRAGLPLEMKPQRPAAVSTSENVAPRRIAESGTQAAAEVGDASARAYRDLAYRSESGDWSGWLRGERSYEPAIVNASASPSRLEADPGGRSGVAHVLGMSLRHFDRLPRLWYLHRLLVQEPQLSYLLGVALIPGLFALAAAAWMAGRDVLGVCLALLAIALPLLWRREHEADSGDHLATMLAVTSVAILAGTQVFYLKDFLQGSDYYRMNTLFKFFNQVWVLWALAAAIALPRLWRAARGTRRETASLSAGESLVAQAASTAHAARSEPWQGKADLENTLDDEAAWKPVVTQPAFYSSRRGWGVLWRLASMIVLAASTVYLIFGTPARLSQRFVGWVPPFGTLDGMAFMQQGRYAWPNDGNWFDLSYDYQAIQWLLENVRGNVVIAESAEVDYYRAGGTRVASMTGLSGLRGAHVSEQRFGEQVGERDGLHREFWSSPSVERTEELIRQLQITLVYVGQLERYQHPEAVQKLANMASEGRLVVLYENEGVVIYAVPDLLMQTEGGWYVPLPQPLPLPLPTLGTQPPARLLIPTQS